MKLGSETPAKGPQKASNLSESSLASLFRLRNGNSRAIERPPHPGEGSTRHPPLATGVRKYFSGGASLAIEVSDVSLHDCFEITRHLYSNFRRVRSRIKFSLSPCTNSLRQTLSAHGKEGTLLCLAGFPSCMPAARDTVIMGDFNCRHDALDHSEDKGRSA